MSHKQTFGSKIADYAHFADETGTPVADGLRRLSQPHLISIRVHAFDDHEISRLCTVELEEGSHPATRPEELFVLAVDVRFRRSGSAPIELYDPPGQLRLVRASDHIVRKLVDVRAQIEVIVLQVGFGDLDPDLVLSG